MPDKVEPFVANAVSLLKQTFFGMARRQSTSTGSCSCLLHCGFARTAVSCSWQSLASFSKRIPLGAWQKTDGTNELLSG